MIPRVGEAVRTGIRYTLRPGAYAILERDGKILLTHQSRPVPEFQLPGGGIDPGEQVLPALHREIVEETGWRVGRLVRVGVFRRYTYMPEYDLWAEKVCRVYFGRPARQVGSPTEADHTAIWTSPELAIELVENDGDRMYLKQLFA